MSGKEQLYSAQEGKFQITLYNGFLWNLVSNALAFRKLQASDFFWICSLASQWPPSRSPSLSKFTVLQGQRIPLMLSYKVYEDRPAQVARRTRVVTVLDKPSFTNDHKEIYRTSWSIWPFPTFTVSQHLSPIILPSWTPWHHQQNQYTIRGRHSVLRSLVQPRIHSHASNLYSATCIYWRTYKFSSRTINPTLWNWSLSSGEPWGMVWRWYMSEDTVARVSANKESSRHKRPHGPIMLPFPSTWSTC